MGHFAVTFKCRNEQWVETREVHQSLLPSLSEYYTQLGQHVPLYQSYQHIYDNVIFTDSSAQQSAIKLALRDFNVRCRFRR